jgi:hypothetical protein
LGSPDRDRDDDIDIAADRIRVRADRMNTLDEPFSGLLVDAGNGYAKRATTKPPVPFRPRSIVATTSISSSAKAVAAIPAHMKECVLDAGRIPAGKELFGIGRIAASAEGTGQCELEVEQTVFAADRTVTASARRDFCGI